jgi:galactokinase
MDAGAAGARLMGAGFGGSVIAVVDSRRGGEIAETLSLGHRTHRVEVVDGALP